MTVLTSNILVVPLFQKPWSLMYALDSTGTTTCPGCPIHLAAPLNVRALPPWDSTTVSVPPSASPPSGHALDRFLSPCTAPLFIFGSEVISLGARAQDPRAPHYFAVSSCRTRTRPTFGHDRVCMPSILQVLLPVPIHVIS